MPRAGSRPQASSTASKFISGSPMPMKTAWLVWPLRRVSTPASRISHGGRFPTKRIEPVAQNVQVSGQPDWELRGTPPPPVAVAHQHRLDRQPSWVRNRALTVPSLERDSRSRARLENGTRSDSSARRAAGQARHLPVARGSAGCPLPHLPGAEAGLAALGERLFEEIQVDPPSLEPLGLTSMAQPFMVGGRICRKLLARLVSSGLAKQQGRDNDAGPRGPRRDHDEAVRACRSGARRVPGISIARRGADIRM